MSACQCIISGHGYTELQLTLTLQRNAHVATGLLQCSTSHITSDGNSASFKTLTAPRAKLRIPVKAQPSTRRTGLRSLTIGLTCDNDEIWAYPTNTDLDIVAFLLLLDTSLLSQAGISYYSQLHDTETSQNV